MLLLMLISAAAAKAEEITSGNFVYDIVQFLGSDEDEAVIIGLADGFEPSGELSFPTTISHKGKDVKVTGLGWSNHAGCESDLPVIGGHHGITSVRIPRYMRFIGRIEFKDCPNIERYEVESGSAVYTTIEGVLVEIADYSGTTRRHLKRYPSAARAASYVVPSSVDDISFGAFAANTHLKKIYLVGEHRLRDCWQFNNRSIETVDCSNSSEYRTDDDGAILDGSVFTGLCPGRVYGKYTVPNSCSYLSSGAFCNSQVDEIVFPAKLSYNGAASCMFMGSMVKKITYLGEKPHLIWECAFMDCANLKQIELGCTSDGELDIQTCAFKGCTSLTTVTLDPATRNIDMSTHAFEDCRSLTSFPLTSKMKIRQLVYREFAGCESLTSFPFGSVGTFSYTQGYMFAGSGLKTVYWPSGQAVVPRGIFADCRQLTKVYLKDTTTDIYADAFARSGLVGISMMGVDWWSRSAFADCPDLIRLYFPDNGKSVLYNTVDFITESPQIVVNNPKISQLTKQDECPDVASLYISMVDGGVPIGNGWRKVYVPGLASELYSQLTASEVEEMYSCEPYPHDNAVKIVPLIRDVKITSVTVNGEETSYSGGVYTAATPASGSDSMDITVNYTVFGNPMTSVYSALYSSVDTPAASPGSDEVQWYSVSGMHINEPTSPGVYIRRTPARTQKILIR